MTHKSGPSAEKRNMSTRDTVCTSSASRVVSEHQEQLPTVTQVLETQTALFEVNLGTILFSFSSCTSQGPAKHIFWISLSLRVLHNYTFLTFCQIWRHFWCFHNPISAFLYVIFTSLGIADSVRVWWYSVGCLTVKCETAPAPSWWSW